METHPLNISNGASPVAKSRYPGVNVYKDVRSMIYTWLFFHPLAGAWQDGGGGLFAAKPLENGDIGDTKWEYYL